MEYIYIALALVLLAIVINRRIDLFSVAAVCLIIYNWHCIYGYVYIASHESVNVNYYEGYIDARVYLIVFAQFVLLIAAIILYDKKHKEDYTKLNYNEQKYTSSQVESIFKFAAIVSVIIIAINVGNIGIEGLSADKAEVWAQTSTLYVTALWLAMAVFTYAIKFKKYRLLWLSLPQMLVHLYIGSRAYFAVICIVALVCISGRGDYSFKRNIAIMAAGFVAMIVIMLYKQIFEQVKSGDIESIIRILQTPDTYNWIFRWGEPRIVLANFNYVVTYEIVLGPDDIFGRLLSIIPFLNDFWDSGEDSLLLSSLIISNLNSSYGLASNIWGEFYAIGSYPLVVIMYIVWLKLIAWGNSKINDHSWIASFALPLISYYAFYIHRMDLLKVIGNAKMLIFAMIIWWFFACLVTKNVSFGIPKNRKQQVE